MAAFRYLVKDVNRSVEFYIKNLGFRIEQDMRPNFASISMGNATLWLSGPQSSAARPMPDGRFPEPGGWNRFVVEVRDLAETVASLRKKGVSFRNDIVIGPGGKQILVDDPDGNPLELFEPAARDRATA